jgi:hypothetical protein
MENWKDIKDLEGYYQISDLGNVRSVKRIVIGRNYPQFVLNPQISYGGYLSVQLRKDKKKYIYYIHRLVALHFCDGYFEGAHINHIDENKLNNTALNLEWCTISQNKKHSPTINCSRKYSESQIKEIRSLKENGMSIYAISKKYNDNSGTISNIINRKTYKNII